MKLSENCTTKLKTWTQSTKWNSSHDKDMERFYLFVDSYQKEHGCTISDESILAETIASYAGVSTDTALFKTVIRNRVSLMYNILDFIKTTGR